MQISIQLEGLSQVLAGLEEVKREVPRAVRRRLEADAPAVWARQRALCPVDDVDGGQLRDSIRWEMRGGRESYGAVAFIVGGEPLLPYLEGRAYNAYAIVQETDPTLRHTHGQAGFMQTPVYDWIPGLTSRVEADVAAVVARASR